MSRIWSVLVVWEMENVLRPRVPSMYASYARKNQDRHLEPPRWKSVKRWRPKSLGQLLGKSKREKPLADCIMYGGRFSCAWKPPPGGRKSRVEWRVATWAIRLITARTDAQLFFGFLCRSSSFNLTVMRTPVLNSVFVLSRLFFSFTWGASCPERVKPPAGEEDYPGFDFSVFDCFS
jgi:hypothetical protein